MLDQLRQAEGKVLVVDDDVDTRRRVRVVLERNGWCVDEAGNEAEALDRVRRSPPHLILLDLTMPVMDGFEFLHRLRVMPGGADVSVVVLSARDVSAAERTRLLEADRILRKGEASMRDLAIELQDFERR